ncbi:MAG: helix-turn-helix domain-containing protein [Candidatus Gastranaerophilales bacterium]|nr:helix-turn-helix domain-containing protein [Candidatus Gastranaerophilales bacterium]
MRQNSKENIAINVRKLREARKLTREKLSLELNFENSYISKLEKQNTNITIEKLDKIADYFGIDTYKLII